MLASQVGNLIGTTYTATLVGQEYYEDEDGVYSLRYEVLSGGRRLEYRVALKQTTSGVLVRGFNIRTGSPGPAASRRLALARLVVDSLFVLCAATQLLCVIYFATRKDLRRKWLYVVLSFLGFPVGIQLQWATGAMFLYVGFKIPAVAVSMPIAPAGLWVMTVCFPVGIIFLIGQVVRRRPAATPPPLTAAAAAG